MPVCSSTDTDGPEEGMLQLSLGPALGVLWHWYLHLGHTVWCFEEARETARAYRGWCQHGDSLAWKGPPFSRIGDVLSEEHPVLNATGWEPSFKGVLRWFDLSFASSQAVRALGEFEGF